MDLVLLLIFAFTVKGDSDESKYVDLLPEEEKEEFIQKVARRIIEKVETKEVANKSSVEIPDEELKEHEALVKKILKEESSNIRRNRMENEKEKEEEDDVSVKSIENLKELQRIDSIDLTLRTGRKKRRDNGKSSEISVEVITENVIIKTKNFGTEDKINKSDEKGHNNDYAQSSKEDIEVRHIESPVTEHIEVKTINFGEDNLDSIVKNNETVQDADTKYDEENTKEKSVKRRAIENTTTVETADLNKNTTIITNINKTESVSASKEYQPTIMDNFDVEKVESSEETTVQPTELATTNTSTSEGTTTTPVTTVNVTTESQGNESKEINHFTQAIYDSEPESDSDCSNETVTDGSNASSNTSDVDETTTVVRYLRSNDYDIVTDAAEVNKSGNVTETIELSIETVTDKNIEETVQYSTINEGSTDKILDTTDKFGTSDNINSMTDGITASPLIIGDHDEAGNVTVSIETANTDIGITSAETTPRNTDKVEEPSDGTSINVSEDIKKISETATDVTHPTNAVNNQVIDGVKAGLISRTRFDIVDDTNNNQVIEVENNEDAIDATNINDLKNDTIALNERILSTIHNELKDTVLAATESIITTMYTQKPTLTTVNRVVNKNKKAKINSAQKKRAIKKSFTKNIDDKLSLVADKAVDMLKDSLLLVKDEQKKIDVFAGLQNEYNRQILDKSKEYQVFEVPADKPPFMKNPVAITEQPYYVPVYNYSPNKAYFNAQNRLGPNADDGNIVNVMETEFNTVEAEDKESDDSAHKSFEYDFGTFKDRPNFENDYYFDIDDNRRKKFGNQGVFSKTGNGKMPQLVKRPTVARKPVFKESHYNPNDYVDIAYDNRIGGDAQGSRTGSMKLPDTDDEIHPFKSIKEKNLKDHIRAVRNILYAQNLFNDPYRPTEAEIETTTLPPETEEDVTDSVKNRAIALDYYFGRMKPEESGEGNAYKKFGYIQRYNKTKNLYNELYNDNLVKLISFIKYKGDMYVDNDYTATPHTDLTEDTLKMTENIKIGKVSDKITIINLKDETDVYNTLEALDEFNLTLRKQDDCLNIYTRVLKDMVHLDDDALNQYDWLGTTVDLQSALDKLLRLIEGVQSIEEIHPSDLELLKYVVFLHKFSNELGESKIYADELRKKQILPRNRRKKKRLLNEKGLLNRVWLYLRKKRSSYKEDSHLEHLNDFLTNLQDALYDLHEAIKNIAKISTFRKQNWFKNIKDLCLTDDKSYLTLLLHITATRLFGLIEDSAKSDLEKDFKRFVRNNRKDTMRTVEEMLFVIRILDYIKVLEKYIDIYI